MVLGFPSQRTPSVGSSRRRRGFQPDEVNKNKELIEPGDRFNIQGTDNAENLTAIDKHLKASDTTNKLASTMTPNSPGPLAPHRRSQAKDNKPTHHPIIYTQAATMDASRPELDPVHFGDVSKPVESETSSIQIITERRPSCWSVASPPETPPTEWNSASVNIDRPTTTKLPIYRFPRLEHKIKGENSSRSFNRQQTKPNPKATASMSKAKKSHELNGSPRVAAPEKDEARATAGAASRKDGHAAESLHQLQQLQNDGRLDADEASKVKAIHEQLLANTMQVSSGIQLESDGSKSWCPTEDTLQAKLLDAKESRIISSATSFQANPNQVSTLPGKPGGPTPPHLRVQSARPGPDDKNKPLPPHLRGSAVPSIATATGKHTTSAMQDAKIPPHLDSPSTAKIGASKGPVLVTTPLPTPQKKDDYCRPTIDMDKEIAATQPVFDIDEEIAAGLRAETSNAFLEAQPTDSNAQETNEQVIYVAPRPRAASPRLKAFGAESKSEVTNKDAKPPADQHPDRNHSTNSKANSFTVESYAGALHDVSSKRKNTKLKFPSKNGAVLNGAESSVKKGKKPAREFESIDYTSELVDWEGKMNPPPVGDEWNRRRPFDPRSRERLSVIEAWREEHAADPKEENRVIVNTASADFQNGEGLAGGDANVLSPIDKMEHETRTCNDDFTQARRHQNAAEAMRDYEAKIAAKPKPVPSGIEGMTKEEKRALRRALIEEERTRVIPPNPHAPAANIYLRPAEFKDMGQVMNIYNHYVQKTSFVLHLDPVDELYWRSRLQEAEDERNPFVVAIHMGEKSCRKQGDIIRRKQENVVGFAVAADFGSKKTLYHSSVELELMVHPDFHRHGIGRTLLDRILAALNPDHHLLECAPFLAFKDICHWVGGGSRQAKAIMVNILYCDGKEDTVTWRKQWLAKYEFQHVGTLPNVGFKEGKLWVMPRCVLKWRSFADLWQPG